MLNEMRRKRNDELESEQSKYSFKPSINSNSKNKIHHRRVNSTSNINKILIKIIK